MTTKLISHEVIKAELDGIKEDIQELKSSTRRLEQFMYQFEGGKAWMFALLAIAGTLGALFGQAFKLITKTG